MRPNRPVTGEQLVDELWDGSPPPSAATALRVHIGRLRHTLELTRGPNAPSSRLPAGPHGYVLRVEPDELDAERFERLVLLARDASSGGDPAAAVPQLTKALDLWRGPALVDIADRAVARGEIARLEDLRALAIEELADARLALGEHEQVIDLVSVALEEYPLRERLTASLMVAQYRTGQQAEALRSFTRLAHRLDDDLGVAPSIELRRLEEDVLLQSSTLDFAPMRSALTASRARAPLARFIGRRDELRALLDAYDAACEGASRLVLVSGAAGIGKTTLTEEFCSRAEGDRAGPLVGHCNAEPTSDYQPIVEILRQVVEQIDPEDRVSLPAQLELVLPELERQETTLDSDTTRGAPFRLFEAIATTLARRVGPPRVFIVEDLHWADRPTLQLLRHLVRHPDLDGTLVVATFRDDEIDGERADTIMRLARSANRTSIRLPPFDHHAVRALVRATAPLEKLPALVDLTATLHDVTGGNPFFLRELLRDLDDELLKLESSAELSLMLSTRAPVGVRALVDRRLAPLSEDTVCVLCAAAILGHELTVQTLSAICDRSEARTLEALEEGLAARMLVEDYQLVDQYLFPHALVRNAIYMRIPTVERQTLHRRVADILTSADAPGSARSNAEIARHYVAAAPLGVQKEAAEYSARAGDDAATRFAFAEAALWYNRAIDLHAELEGNDPRIGGLHLALGRALANDKQSERARDALTTAAALARESGDPALLIEVALASDNPWALGADYQPHALELLQEALAVVAPSDDECRVRLLDGIATNLYYVDSDRERDAAFEALDLAQRIDCPKSLAVAQRAVHLWHTHQPEQREERLDIARRAYALSAAAGGPTGLLLAQRGLIVDLLENQQIDEFERTLDAYEVAAPALGSPHDIYWSMALRATQVTMAGDLAEAEQRARGAMLRGHELDQISDGAFLLQRFVIRFEQARLSEEAPTLQAVGTMQTVYRAGAALHAVALADTGQADRGVALARSTLGRDGSGLPRDAFWLAGVSLFAAVAAVSEHQELSALLRDLLEPCADNVVVFGAGAAMLGTGHHWIGELAATLGDTDAALDHYAEATAIARRLRAPYWIAQSAISAAAALRARGRVADRAEAERRINEAMAIAEPFGYGRIAARAKQLA